MRSNASYKGGQVSAFWSVAFAISLFISNLHAAPRTPLPPFPEVVLTRVSFDDPWTVRSEADAVEYPFGMLVSTWSGYALERDFLVLSPFVLPCTASTGKTLVPGRNAAIRFWFCPSWSSAGIGGQGPGRLARLLEMAAMDGVSIGFKWTLQVAEDGNSVYLAEAVSVGLQNVLSAMVQWESGQWYLVTLNFTANETHLYVNTTRVAEGRALANTEVMLANTMVRRLTPITSISHGRIIAFVGVSQRPGIKVTYASSGCHGPKSAVIFLAGGL